MRSRYECNGSFWKFKRRQNILVSDWHKILPSIEQYNEKTEEAHQLVGNTFIVILTEHVLVSFAFFSDQTWDTATLCSSKVQISKQRLNRIYIRMVRKSSFVCKVNATKQNEIHPVQRIIVAFSMLLHSLAIDVFVKICANAWIFILVLLKELCEEMVEEFSSKYLRHVNENYLKRLFSIYATRSVKAVRVVFTVSIGIKNLSHCLGRSIKGKTYYCAPGDCRRWNVDLASSIRLSWITQRHQCFQQFVNHAYNLHKRVLTEVRS